ncbi:hypothetical protein niasHS_003255 [Heterodera schachtii]|uniref:Uncharacterized protein n=1 Tax=Heterodera schachtii TaxID=97005 RepID=A0ABD2KG21_HETSC
MSINSSFIPPNGSTPNLADCANAKDYVTDFGYFFVRWAHLITGSVTLLLLLNISVFIAKKPNLPLHGNLKLLLLNVLFLYSIFALSYLITSVRYLFIFATFSDPCQCLTPIWLAFLLRMPAYVYLVASPLFHFGIMVERVRATIFVGKYEREGIKCGIGITIFMWLLAVLFCTYIVITAFADTVTFSKPLVYLSMTTSFNAQVFINIHYLFLFLVICVALADYLLIKLNKLAIQRAKNKVMPYNLSRSYQAKENIVTIRLLFPLDFSYTLFFTIFIISSAFVRFYKDEMSLLVYNRAYEGIQLILSMHAIISLSTYLYFLKRSRGCQSAEELTVAQRTREHFRVLQSQWKFEEAQQQQR